MKEAVSEEKFLESIGLIEGKIGKYIENSKKFNTVQKIKTISLLRQLNLQMSQVM